MQTVSQIIDTLGGTSAVADKLDTTASRVSNWRAFGRFPDSLTIHNRLKELCDEAGVALPAALFQSSASDTAA